MPSSRFGTCEGIDRNPALITCGDDDDDDGCKDAFSHPDTLNLASASDFLFSSFTSRSGAGRMVPPKHICRLTFAQVPTSGSPFFSLISPRKHTRRGGGREAEAGVRRRASENRKWTLAFGGGTAIDSMPPRTATRVFLNFICRIMALLHQKHPSNATPARGACLNAAQRENAEHCGHGGNRTTHPSSTSPPGGPEVGGERRTVGTFLLPTLDSFWECLSISDMNPGNDVNKQLFTPFLVQERAPERRPDSAFFFLVASGRLSFVNLL